MGVFLDIPPKARWIPLHMPRDINKAIICEHHKVPTLDEITHMLSRVKVFSKLGAKDSFWCIHLDTQLSYLTTFNTHKGCYQFLCMPFDLKMSQDVFQMHMDQITNRLLEFIAIHYDICVYGKDTAEHDRKLATTHADSYTTRSNLQLQ